MPRGNHHKLPFFLLQWLLLLADLLHTSLGDLGTAAYYSPPYSPTMCYGSDPTQFPSSNLFGGAGSGIWDNGASCGRQYFVKCISGSIPGACVSDEIIQILIIDYAPAFSNPSASGASIVLSDAAFRTIANISAAFINIELQQV